jgi:hypothetical protein
VALITNNLKHQETVSDDYYSGLPINVTPENPAFKAILDNLYRELTLIISRYSRVVVVRLDLHPSGKIEPNNIDISEFRRSFTRKLASKSLAYTPRGSIPHKYTSKVAYSWVRESGRNDYNDGVHWHLFVAIKLNKDMRPHTQAKLMQDEILASWETSAGGKSDRNNRSSWFFLERNKMTKEARLQQQAEIAKNPDRPEDVLLKATPILTRKNNKDIVLGGVIDETFYAISYLAKVYSKVRTHKSKDANMFGHSNIKTKDSKEGREDEIQSELNKLKLNLEIKIPPVSLEPKVIKALNTQSSPPLF